MVKIIYEDSSLLVIDKPPGLVVDPAATVKEKTLADILQEDFNITLFRGGIVHRLDKDTSGVLLVAKTQSTLENLQFQFKERKIKKEYIALVHGQIMEGGVVDASIARNPGNREKFTVILPIQRKGAKLIHPPGGLGWHLEDGREAVTEYQPLKNFQFSILNFQKIFNDLNKNQIRKLERMKYNQFTLLTCKPKTGRTHQIRVHLKYIGYPITSDEKYVGRKRYRLDKRWCPRQFLHAAKIGFYHPVSGEWMEVESELPEDLKNTLGFLNDKDT